jgi:hypothetical protein
MKVESRLFISLVTTVLVGVWSVSPARAAESNQNADAAPVVVKEAFQKALQLTRTVVEKQHMVCIVDVESLGEATKGVSDMTIILRLSGSR